MKLSRMSVLSHGEIETIHEASIDILTTCGVKIANSRMLAFLKKRGLAVDDDKGIVRFTRDCIEDAVSAVPTTFDVFDREGNAAFTLGNGAARVAAGHNAVFWVDSDTGETRPSTVADVEAFARICDGLEQIHMIGVPVMPQDVPDPAATLLYGVRACIENSSKPIFFSTDSAAVNRAVIRLLRAAFAGNLDDQVYAISQFSPTSPLFWEANVLDAVMDTVDTGVPIAILPEPNAGVSCPYTLAGLLTMNNAECLSGLAMVQMLRPGTRVMYANSWTTSDMRTGAALVGSTETTICRIAAAQLARYYHCPSHTTAPNSDNHAHDEQNAWEKTFSMLCSVAAGHDLIVNCGMFATGMTCSLEQLLMDEEISAMSLRIASGIKVTEDTVARDLIKQIGPRGDTYLTTDHTLRWLRSAEYLTPRLSVSGPFASWQANGGKDTYALARENARALAGRNVAPLPAEKQRKLEEIISTFNPTAEI